MDIYAAILNAQAKGTPSALCTVIRARGSVPRHAGSKMLVLADGQFVGTVGGGEMKAALSSPQSKPRSTGSRASSTTS